MEIEKINILGAEYLSYVKFIATEAPTSFVYYFSLSQCGGMFRRFLPLFWSHQKPNEENVESTSDEFRERSSSDPAPQAKKPSKKKLRSYSMRKNLNKLTKRPNTPAQEEKKKTSPIEEDDEISQLEETLEIIQISESQIGIIKSTWNTLSRELGEGLSYLKNDTENNPVTEPFLRLFEEYPMSQQFFLEFRGTPTEALRNDVRLNTVLQEHGVRVMRVVEKVIGRLEDLEKVMLYNNQACFFRHESNCTNVMHNNSN